MSIIILTRLCIIDIQKTWHLSKIVLFIIPQQTLFIISALEIWCFIDSKIILIHGKSYVPYINIRLLSFYLNNLKVLRFLHNNRHAERKLGEATKKRQRHEKKISQSLKGHYFFSLGLIIFFINILHTSVIKTKTWRTLLDDSCEISLCISWNSIGFYIWMNILRQFLIPCRTT